MDLCQHQNYNPKAILISQLCTYSIMLLYMTALLFLTICKYKSFSFTLRLMIALETAIVVLWIIVNLDFRIINLCDSDTTTYHSVVQNKVRSLLYVVFLLGAVATTAGMCVFWLFALKYWSVALKFDLVVKE